MCVGEDVAVLPDDEAGARARIQTMTRPIGLKELEVRIAEINDEKVAAINDQDFEKAANKIEDIPKGFTKKLIDQLKEISFAKSINDLINGKNRDYNKLRKESILLSSTVNIIPLL